jgi:hypothetical protein
MFRVSFGQRLVMIITYVLLPVVSQPLTTLPKTAPPPPSEAPPQPTATAPPQPTATATATPTAVGKNLEPSHRMKREKRSKQAPKGGSQ